MPDAWLLRFAQDDSGGRFRNPLNPLASRRALEDPLSYPHRLVRGRGIRLQPTLQPGHQADLAVQRDGLGVAPHSDRERLTIILPEPIPELLPERRVGHRD